MTIRFPVVLYLRGVLTVEDGKDSAFGINFSSNNAMLIKASVKKRYVEESGWILDSNGLFREIEPKSRHREWAAPFSFLVQLVMAEFYISDPEPISCRELIERLSLIPDRFQEAPIASDLRRHLGKYKPNELVSEQMLIDWPI